MNVPIQLQFIFEDRLTGADDGSECTERQFSGSCLCDAGCEKGSSKKYQLAKHTSAFRHSSGGILQTGAILEECANYKELAEQEQARMPDVSVCVHFGKKLPLETVAAGAR